MSRPAHTMLQIESGVKAVNDEYGRGRQFVRVANALLRCHGDAELTAKEFEYNGTVYTKSMAEHLRQAQTFDSVWQNAEARDLAESYIASIAEFSVFDLIARYGRRLPANLRHGMVSSGFVSDVAAEGEPKVVKNLDIAELDLPRIKTAGVMVLTEELMRASEGRIVGRIFEDELRKSVVRGMNQAVIGRFTEQHVPYGEDAMAALRNALSMVERSTGFVVLATPRATRDLALASDGRMPISGGEFSPGLHVVEVEADPSAPGVPATPALRVIPASRVSYVDYGMTIRNADHATINFAASPEAPSEVVSLWQTNSHALLVEREFALATDAAVVCATYPNADLQQ